MAKRNIFQHTINGLGQLKGKISRWWPEFDEVLEACSFVFPPLLWEINRTRRFEILDVPVVQGIHKDAWTQTFSA